MNRAVIKVEGMTCEGCAAIVAKAVRTAPGVLAVEVNYEKGEAIVGVEICCPIPKDKILSALKQAGYTGKFVDSNRSAASSSTATMQPAVGSALPAPATTNGEMARDAASKSGKPAGFPLREKRL